MRLKGKVAIVTGGSSGIGEAISKKFAKEGSRIIVVAREQSKIDNVVNIINENGGDAIGISADITDMIQVERVVNKVVLEYGQIDIFVNNAGITADFKIQNMTEKHFDDVIGVNLKGVFNCGSLVSKIMIEQNHGVILNTSSVVGLYGNFGQTNYSASKWGVIGMTKTWAKELGKYNVRVNAVAPGFTLTDMVKKMPPKVLDSIKDKTPLKMLAKPEDIANAFLFLASDEARFVTGTVLSVDGGLVL